MSFKYFQNQMDKAKGKQKSENMLKSPDTSHLLPSPQPEEMALNILSHFPSKMGIFKRNKTFQLQLRSYISVFLLPNFKNKFCKEYRNPFHTTFYVLLIQVAFLEYVYSLQIYRQTVWSPQCFIQLLMNQDSKKGGRTEGNKSCSCCSRSVYGVTALLQSDETKSPQRTAWSAQS